MNGLLDTQQYAELVGVSRRTVQRWVQDGLIFGVRIGGTIYIDATEEPPNARQIAGTASSDVLVPEAITNPEFAGFPEEEVEEEDEEPDTNFLDLIDEEEDEEECHDPAEFGVANLRKAFATREEADNYALPIIGISTVFKRCSDGFFQVAIEASV